MMDNMNVESLYEDICNVTMGRHQVEFTLVM